MITRAAQLRMLIRTDEALIQHLVQWADSIQDAEGAAPPALLSRIRDAVTRKNERRSEYLALSSTDAACSQPGAGRPASAVAGHSSPAAPASPETLAGSLVTHGAAQPGFSSP